MTVAVEALTDLEIYEIGLAAVSLVASMQILGHANPEHVLMYRRGEVSEATRFIEDFARVCKHGANREPEAHERLRAYANRKGMQRLVMNMLGDELAPVATTTAPGANTDDGAAPYHSRRPV